MRAISRENRGLLIDEQQGGRDLDFQLVKLAIGWAVSPRLATYLIE